MRKLIAWPLANGLYWIGHGSYLWLDAIDTKSEDWDGIGDPRTPLFRVLWRVYQWCIPASSDACRWGGVYLWLPQSHKDPQ